MLNFNEVESEKSFGPIKPGVEVPVLLEKVEVSADGNLDFFFQGTDVANAGQFKPRFWANNFDPADEKYTAENEITFLFSAYVMHLQSCTRNYMNDSILVDHNSQVDWGHDFKATNF